MKRTGLLLVGVLALVGLIHPTATKADPGDTTWVKTLNFDSTTTRRGWFQFPEQGKTWNKILMYYTLKCDPATTADGFDCGEWDYLTYTNVYEHTGRMDSTLLTHPNFIVNGATPDVFNYHTTPIWDVYQQKQYFQVVNSVITVDDATIGLGSLTSATPFETTNGQGRAQYLFTAAELTSAGLTAGDISALRMNLTALGGTVNNLHIRMKATSLTELIPTAYENGGFTDVYASNTTFPSVGWNTLYFLNTFNWDGTSNVIVEFLFDGPAGTTNSMVQSYDAGFNAGVTAVGDAHYLDFEDRDFVAVPKEAFNNIDQEITISLWQYGDPDIQPQNDYVFEGRDANGNRVLNSHLPWSNSSVYWDAGNVGNAFDRIFKAANNNQFEGQWNHWAFTKNATTGDMAIYLNGNLWHSGTGMNRSMSGIETFFIGARAGNGNSPYDGFIDEFRVWNVALDQQTIAEWMNKDLDQTHPNAANLQVYYNFDEGTGFNVTDQSGNGHDGVLSGMPEWKDYDGALPRNITGTTMRPNVVFEKGQYNSYIDSIIVVDSVLRSREMVVLYNNTVEPYLPTDTLFVWEESYSYTYDSDGNLIDSILVAGTSTLNKVDQPYYSDPFEVINRYEIGRFITPYGIGLDLGDEGFTWLYDVTDYASLLQGMVDFQAGNNQELIDVKFAMIEGTPPRDVVQLDRLWNGRASYRYNTLADDVNLSATSVAVHQDAASFKVKTRLTGHGHNSNDGSFPHCCEWRDNTHFLLVNGQQVGAWSIFQYNECALNPVYPQGGTWPGAREGWCPGDVVKDVEYEVTDFVAGDSFTVDYDITDVPTNNLGMGNGNYVVAVQSIQYGAANFGTDVEVYDVIAPNNWEYYSRMNPICAEPRIVIRNNGSTPLTSVKIRYWVREDRWQVYNWTGNLGFMEKEEVSLPIQGMYFFEMNGSNEFHVRVSEPNGGTDEYEHNDEYVTRFDVPELLSKRIVVELVTNERASENFYTLKDMEGNNILVGANLDNNTAYKDTLELEANCYTLTLEDSGNDGLSYWADPAAGGGVFRVWELEEDNSIMGLKSFEPEFGKTIQYTFSVGFPVGTEEKSVFQRVELFPNPSSGTVYLDLAGVEGSLNLTVTNALGQVVETRSWTQIGQGLVPVEMDGLPNGWYHFTLNNEAGDVFTRKIVLAK